MNFFPGHRALRDAASIDDLRHLAARRLPRAIFDFLDGGAELERVLDDNRKSFDRVKLVPHALRDVSVRDQSMELFGQRFQHPFAIAPTGMSGLVWPQAEKHLANAAKASGIPMVLSTVASCAIEEIGPICGNAGWFQLYASRNRTVDLDLLKRARQSGFGALVITVDLAVAGVRRRDVRNGFYLPFRPRVGMALEVLTKPAWFWRQMLQGGPVLPNLEPYYGKGISVMQQLDAQTDSSFDWDALQVFRKAWDGPLVLKGLLSAAAADQAVAYGVDAVVVSNHGGRQLDCCQSTLDALPGIVAKVDGRIPVLMDGGIRSGSDVARALALGATAVLLGRPTLYGAAVAGRAGIEHALSLLTSELDTTMALLGCRNLQEIAELVRHVPD